MTTRPHDALFKAAFEAPAGAAALLRELVPPAVRKAVVWKTLDHERGSFVDARLADQHSDLLFSAQLRGGELMYFLLEHQSTSDPAMPQRTLSYQSRIWDRFVKEHPGARLAPVIAVVVSHEPGGWTAARAFEDLFDPAVMALGGLAALVPRCSMIVEDLMQLSNADLAARSLGASRSSRCGCYATRVIRRACWTASMAGFPQCSSSNEPGPAGTASAC
jgi:hypothetical protein